MVAIWHVMTHRFGYRWTRQYGSTPSPQWARDLAGLTDVQVTRGLEWVKTSGATWPPSLPEFRHVCSHIDVSEMREHAPSFPRLESDVDKEHRKHTAQKWLRKWRRILHGERRTETEVADDER